jgi:hypothetical protein
VRNVARVAISPRAKASLIESTGRAVAAHPPSRETPWLGRGCWGSPGCPYDWPEVGGMGVIATAA